MLAHSSFTHVGQFGDLTLLLKLVCRRFDSEPLSAGDNDGLLEPLLYCLRLVLIAPWSRA